MLNFAEQTGSGAVIFVWSFLFVTTYFIYINKLHFMNAILVYYTAHSFLLEIQ